MIERYQLRYFLAVVEAGAFSRAAQQVNVTQPTLSTGIAKLERALGAPLFVRNSRRVHLTPAGARLVAHARAIEKEFNAFEASGEPEPRARSLRLGVLSTIPARFVEAFVRANARAERPDILELVEGTESDLTSRLERRRIDVALSLLRPADDRFRPEPLREEGYALAVPDHHRLAPREVVEPEDLVGEVMIVRRHCELLRDESRYFTERGVRPRFSFRTHSDERAAAMVRAGLGVTVTPDSWREPGVRLVRLARFNFRRQLGLRLAEGWSEPEGAGSPVLHAIRTSFPTAP